MAHNQLPYLDLHCLPSSLNSQYDSLDEIVLDFADKYFVVYFFWCFKFDYNLVLNVYIYLFLFFFFLQGDLKHSHFIVLTVHDLGCNRKYFERNNQACEAYIDVRLRQSISSSTVKYH